MNTWKFALQSFKHHWRVNLAVILAAIISTAVLTGALLVGDSMRGSLTGLTIQRLGHIDQIVLADHFFSQSLATRLKSTAGFDASFRDALPAILLPQASAEFSSDTGKRRATKVTMLACSNEFWSLSATNPPQVDLSDRSIAINQPLADALNVEVGDEISLYFGKATSVAADSPLADKSDVGDSMSDLKVIAILPIDGLGRFSLHPSQHLPLNAFVPLELLQDAFDQGGKVNSILVSSSLATESAGDHAVQFLQENLRPTLTDAGLNLHAVQRTYKGDDNDAAIAYQYASLSTEKMVFSTEAENAIVESVKKSTTLAGRSLQPAFTYLANSIRTAAKDSPDIPYSMVTAIDSTAQLGPLLDDGGTVIGPLAEDEIVLNSWAAEDLAAKIGDRILLAYFDPETTHGQTKEHTSEFRLKAIIPLVKPSSGYRRNQAAQYDQRPGWINDPDLTPTVKGITDQESIDDWDAPFPFDYKRIQARAPKDDDYWKFYRTTPKAFVSMATGKKLWGSRFGSVTSFRIPAVENESEVAAQIEDAITGNLSAFGFQIMNVKRDGLAAASGTTPFNGLFMGFSFFIMAAAVSLIALLFRLSVEQRASDTGVLQAVGLNRWQTAKLSLVEGLLVSAVSAVIGVFLGIAYAKLMVTGLRTWWLDAVVTPFLQLHITATSLLLGLLLGIVVTCLTILWTIFGLRKVSTRQLLAGEVESNVLPAKNVAAQKGIFASLRNQSPWIAFALAIVSVISGAFFSGEAQAGAFFGCGSLCLIGMLTLVARWLQNAGRGAHNDVGVDRRVSVFNEKELMIRNASRNPSRSVLTIGLMASACFLIIAISAFRLAPSSEGSAGFGIVGTSELPLFDDLNDAAKRDQIFGSKASVFNGSTFLALRYQEGEDASCRNLYQTTRPRILGVTPTMIQHFDRDDFEQFQFAGSIAASEIEKKNPWRILERDRKSDEPIPVILDKNTAMYSLHLYGVGKVFELDYGDGRKITFQVAGLLSNSILQGSILVSETNLLDRFPDVGGYRFFLVDTPPGAEENAGAQLEETFSNEGFDSVSTTELLQDLLAVQNTYLSTFQSLGGLGLLLGTFGLMAVQLRNVWQRRSEIALLRATGFSQSRIARLILLEHAFLLLGGLAIGFLAAMLTVLPHILIGGARIPLMATVWMLLLIVVVGIATGWLAVRSSNRLPILASLRAT